MEDRRGPLLLSVLAFGALWGLAEATLGFLLHLLSRLAPLPHLAGFFMFPLGLLCMLQAVRATGRSGAALLTAVVAAVLKLASAALPGVGLAFVSNPALSILAEGLLSFLLLRRLDLQAPAQRRALLPALLVTGLAWRGLFLLLVALLPVQKGILTKGPAALASFLLVDSLVNALLVWAAAQLRARTRIPLARARAVLVRPAAAAAALALAFGANAAVALL